MKATATRPTFGCSHPKTAANTHKAGFDHRGRQQIRCATCANARHAEDQRPCQHCGEPIGPGEWAPGDYHARRCEPTTCTCDTPRPNGIGECAGCRRLVVGEGAP